MAQEPLKKLFFPQTYLSGYKNHGSELSQDLIYTVRKRSEAVFWSKKLIPTKKPFRNLFIQ
jgi:hypothetical protein